MLKFSELLKKHLCLYKGGVQFIEISQAKKTPKTVSFIFVSLIMTATTTYFHQI
jgi:hypothetical protein